PPFRPQAERAPDVGEDHQVKLAVERSREDVVAIYREVWQQAVEGEAPAPHAPDHAWAHALVQALRLRVVDCVRSQQLAQAVKDAVAQVVLVIGVDQQNAGHDLTRVAGRGGRSPTSPPQTHTSA